MSDPTDASQNLAAALRASCSSHLTHDELADLVARIARVRLDLISCLRRYEQDAERDHGGSANRAHASFQSTLNAVCQESGLAVQALSRKAPPAQVQATRPEGPYAITHEG